MNKHFGFNPTGYGGCCINQILSELGENQSEFFTSTKNSVFGKFLLRPNLRCNYQFDLSLPGRVFTNKYKFEFLYQPSLDLLLN